MPTLFPDDATDLRDEAVRAQASPTRVVDTSRLNWITVCWPSVAFCAVMGGILLATQDSRVVIEDVIDGMRHLIIRRPAAAQTEPSRVLIITANPAYSRNTSATLSPRGFDPLPARSLEEVKRIMASYGPEFRLAVLDDALPDSAAIAHALEQVMPPDRIIVIQRASHPEEVGHMLLDRL